MSVLSGAPDGRIVVAVADFVNETGEKDLDVLSGLLVTSLEQSRHLAVMTKERVLDLAARDGHKEASLVNETLGREVGKAHAIQALLLPAIRRLGKTYSLEIRVIDPVRDRHLFTLSDRATSREALLESLDELSERTRTELGEGKGDVGKASVQLGLAMTRSLEAYQHYLAGLEVWNRDGLRAAGLREFEEALRLDPQFAAAHAELAKLLELDYGDPEAAAPHWQAADAGLDRMPEKERLLYRLTRAHLQPAMKHFDREEALRLADEALARFPDDKFAVTSAALAFRQFDLPDRWEPTLRRALALDPGYYWAASSLVQWLGPRTTDALGIARRAVETRRSPANLAVLAGALWATGDADGAVSAAREALRADPGMNSQITSDACGVLREKGAVAECLPVWRRVVAEGMSRQERDFARRELMTSFAYQGRIRDALQIARSAPAFEESLNPGFVVKILSIGHPRSNNPRALEAARRLPNPQFRRNHLTWLGAMDEAEQITASLDGKGFEIVEQVNHAIALYHRGNPAKAAEVIGAVRAETFRMNYVGDLYGMAYLHAEALLAAGRPEEAAAIWPVRPPCRCTSALDVAQQYPPLALVRARASEQLGRRDDAIRDLDGVITFWKDADADLPLFVEAKAMRARLAAAGPTEATATPSIAVLPFADMSPKHDQEYFADGVAEEILNALAHVDGLKVVGRTSSFFFKGKSEDLKVIGQKLGVANVLEGSLRKDGNGIRITAQLIRVSDGTHFWSESYDRKLSGIFKVQDEIAKAVVGALKVKLMPGTTVGTQGITANTEAHQHYLRGRDVTRASTTDNLKKAEKEYRKAVALDPAFALAWAGLAHTLRTLEAFDSANPSAKRREGAALAADGPSRSHRTFRMGTSPGAGYGEAFSSIGRARTSTSSTHTSWLPGTPGPLRTQEPTGSHWAARPKQSH